MLIVLQVHSKNTEKTSALSVASAASVVSMPTYADAHFHISNYALQGVSLKKVIDSYMSGRVARSVVMPIPLHQKSDGFEQFANNQIHPNYYLGSRSELYYYSFVDALVAKEVEKLSKQDQVRLDPMITGFNPMDRYAAQQIKRVLLTFPGVFSGIGEFTVHKEIVSRKIAGDAIKMITRAGVPPDVSENGKVTLYSPALTDIFNVAAETGLVAMIHSDIHEVDVTFDGKVLKTSVEPYYVSGMKHLCRASPDAKVIWAHTGLGRFVKPALNHLDIVGDILDECPNWSVDISWDLVQQRIVNPEPGMPLMTDWVNFITRYQDRVLWGSDTVMYSSNKSEGEKITKGEPISVVKYNEVIDIVNPLLNALDPDVAKKIRLTNYIRLFDTARSRVRNWERMHVDDDVWNLPIFMPIPIENRN